MTIPHTHGNQFDFIWMFLLERDDGRRTAPRRAAWKFPKLLTRKEKFYGKQGPGTFTSQFGGQGSATLTPQFLQGLSRLGPRRSRLDRKSTRLNSSHPSISYAVFCLKKKKKKHIIILY